MVHGVDVWINTPRRPWEACGTSGMKVLVNGGLNCSELDGWWEEAYAPEVGWALGDGLEHHQDTNWDSHEANELYDLLENQIIPEFYDRNSQGYPATWLQRIRESMACLTPHYSANRAVREYTEKYYLPGAQGYRERTADQAKVSFQIIGWKQELEKRWKDVRFGNVKANTVTEGMNFEVEVYLNGINTEMVTVELFANAIESNLPERYKMQLLVSSKEENVPTIYHVIVPKASERPMNVYTPRVIPFSPNVCVPIEMNSVIWQK
jgi:starch phosphorylase